MTEAFGMRYLSDRGQDNEHCPEFIAYADVDSYVEADDNLNLLIKMIVEDRTRLDCGGEDVVIYDKVSQVVAVIQADNTVTRFPSKSSNGRKVEQKSR